jgi:hypothetical protein
LVLGLAAVFGRCHLVANRLGSERGGAAADLREVSRTKLIEGVGDGDAPGVGGTKVGEMTRTGAVAGPHQV